MTRLPSSPPPSAAAQTPSADRSPSPLSDAEAREREAYVDRNLWLAFIGLALFFLALWGT